MSGYALTFGLALVQGLGAGVYYPAISAFIQRLFTGRDRSRAFGFLGGVVGISTAAGPPDGPPGAGSCSAWPFRRRPSWSAGNSGRNAGAENRWFR